MVELPPQAFITNFHNRIRNTVSTEYTDDNTVGLYINNSSHNTHNTDVFANELSTVGSRRATTRRRINYSEDNFNKYDDLESDVDYESEEEETTVKKRKIDTEVLEQEYYKHVKDILDPKNEDEEIEEDSDGVQADFPSFDDPLTENNFTKFKYIKDSIINGKLTRKYSDIFDVQISKVNVHEGDRESGLDYKGNRQVPIKLIFNDPNHYTNSFIDYVLWNINDTSISIQDFLKLYLHDLQIEHNESLFHKLKDGMIQQIEKYQVAARLPVKQDLVAMIKLDCFLGRQNLTDTLYLNLRDDTFNLNDICESICADLGLKREWLSILSYTILKKVLDIKLHIINDDLEDGILLSQEDLMLALRLDFESLGQEYQPVVTNMTKTEMEKKLEDSGRRRANNRRNNRRNL
ncbi:uncharacterized protein HGUI_01689 [Hanseniaspora guilliermondii]|uniref:Chromatin structure-remodeling complex subunit SFH1 n=1 Tax=Hanseniaspora guilliermondii TaxID=56406 RepID=A0A1L0CM45_9ASCO|nr:uncharacterized protein HGUI_01689 [Hanseniaspora guilliermondii]